MSKCASLCVKTSVCNQTVIIKDKETNGDAACHVGTSKLQYVPLHKAFSNLSIDMVLVAHFASSYCFSDSFQTVKVSNSFHGWNILWPDLSYVALTTNLDYFACIVNMATKKIM